MITYSLNSIPVASHAPISGTSGCLDKRVSGAVYSKKSIRITGRSKITQMPVSGFRAFARYIAYALGFGLLGAAVCGVAALFAGRWLIENAVQFGPGDPGDAPVYALMALTFLGVVAGVVAGIISGLVIARWRRRAPGKPAQREQVLK